MADQVSRLNPIMEREWRGFLPRLRDWRLWIGVRLPRQPREWGLPAISWYLLAPYVQWVILILLFRIDPWMKAFITPGGIFGIFIAGLGWYACGVAAAIGAATVTRERERGTWDQLAVTPLSRWDLVVGYWLAGALPLALGIGISVAGWVLLYPHYLSLLEALGTFETRQEDLLRYGILLLARVVALTALGIALSAACARTTVATAAAVAGAALVLLAELGIVQGVAGVGEWRALPLTLAAYATLTYVSLQVAAVHVLEEGANA
jgi:ABC-type transport system involved in multi-copper enzyme maturation permease subunit